MDTVAIAQQYMRGDFTRPTSHRTKKRDKVMRMIFSKPGLPTVVAAHVGLTRQAIVAWDQVPVKYIRQVAELINMTPHEIRPDILDIFDESPPRTRK
jgi:hypothetical protein